MTVDTGDRYFNLSELWEWHHPWCSAPLANRAWPCTEPISIYRRIGGRIYAFYLIAIMVLWSMHKWLWPCLSQHLLLYIRRKYVESLPHRKPKDEKRLSSPVAGWRRECQRLHPATRLAHGWHHPHLCGHMSFSLQLTKFPFRDWHLPFILILCSLQEVWGSLVRCICHSYRQNELPWVPWCLHSAVKAALQPRPASSQKYYFCALGISCKHQHTAAAGRELIRELISFHFPRVKEMMGALCCCIEIVRASYEKPSSLLIKWHKSAIWRGSEVSETPIERNGSYESGCYWAGWLNSINEI